MTLGDWGQLRRGVVEVQPPTEKLINSIRLIEKEEKKATQGV